MGARIRARLTFSNGLTRTRRSTELPINVAECFPVVYKRRTSCSRFSYSRLFQTFDFVTSTNFTFCTYVRKSTTNANNTKVFIRPQVPRKFSIKIYLIAANCEKVLWIRRKYNHNDWLSIRKPYPVENSNYRFFFNFKRIHFIFSPLPNKLRSDECFENVDPRLLALQKTYSKTLLSRGEGGERKTIVVWMAASYERWFIYSKRKTPDRV